MASIICLILFTIMLAVTVNYCIYTVFHLCKTLVYKSGIVNFWFVGVMVGICYILHHFI